MKIETKYKRETARRVEEQSSRMMRCVALLSLECFWSATETVRREDRDREKRD